MKRGDEAGLSLFSKHLRRNMEIRPHVEVQKSV
jgi:hypothetical protein